MLEKTSLMICMSIVDELLTLAGLPSGAVNICSGEVDGLVSRYPAGPSINQSSRNEAQPSIKGYALFLRNPYKHENTQSQEDHINQYVRTLNSRKNKHIERATN